MTTNESESVRLDIWLWAARFYKTRSLAKQAVEAGKVQVAGDGAKPSRALRPGDVLEIRRGEERFEVTVAALSTSRGAATIASQLYVESEQARERRLREAAERRAAIAGYRPPSTKPDKRARRLIQALGDLDAL